MQIGYFLKNLDLTNVYNAFLSGMEEDLEMFGNQLVTSSSIYTVGYVIGQIPSNLLLTRVSPRWVIPSVGNLFVPYLGIRTTTIAHHADAGDAA